MAFLPYIDKKLTKSGIGFNLLPANDDSSKEYVSISVVLAYGSKYRNITYTNDAFEIFEIENFLDEIKDLISGKEKEMDFTPVIEDWSFRFYLQYDGFNDFIRDDSYTVHVELMSHGPNPALIMHSSHNALKKFSQDLEYELVHIQNDIYKLDKKYYEGKIVSIMHVADVLTYPNDKTNKPIDMTEWEYYKNNDLALSRSSGESKITTLKRLREEKKFLVSHGLLK